MSYDYDRRIGSTVPLPKSFPADEIGLMTKAEFLDFRNPGEKLHPSEAYDFTIATLNEDRGRTLGDLNKVRAEQLSNGIRITSEDKLIAIIHEGTAYYESARFERQIPSDVFDRMSGERVNLGIKAYRQVKYLSEIIPLISPVAKKNVAEYPVVLQHILVKGEPMTVRAEKKPALNKGVSLAILNAEGLRVATAADEWGATLLAVVQEYRGSGLGKIIGSYWYEYNPNWKSGGFTQSGQGNALALWKERVHEFSARGWYSQLVREGRIEPKRLQEILKGIGQRTPKVPKAESPEMKATGQILVWADDVTFIVYDRAFLEEPEEKFIHGFGFFRDNNMGTFLYRIEYDRPYAMFVTKVALQIARDNGEQLYDAADDAAHDLLEDVDEIPGVMREGDYLLVTKDLLPVKAMAQLERRIRKPVDPYGETYNTLIEMAESKWS